MESTCAPPRPTTAAEPLGGPFVARSQSRLNVTLACAEHAPALFTAQSRCWQSNVNKHLDHLHSLVGEHALALFIVATAPSSEGTSKSCKKCPITAASASPGGGAPSRASPAARAARDVIPTRSASTSSRTAGTASLGLRSGPLGEIGGIWGMTGAA
eukprot:360329-Chlamydomonas_euryale.AAC.1